MGLASLAAGGAAANFEDVEEDVEDVDEDVDVDEDDALEELENCFRFSGRCPPVLGSVPLLPLVSSIGGVEALGLAGLQVGALHDVGRRSPSGAAASCAAPHCSAMRRLPSIAAFS